MASESVKIENINGSIVATGNVGGNINNLVTNAFNKTKVENVPDLAQLAEELARLREALRQNAKHIEHDIAVSEVGQAEKAATDKNFPKALEHLNKAGRWAFEIAKELGVSVAVDMMKRAGGF